MMLELLGVWLHLNLDKIEPEHIAPDEIRCIDGLVQKLHSWLYVL